MTKLETFKNQLNLLINANIKEQEARFAWLHAWTEESKQRANKDRAAARIEINKEQEKLFALVEELIKC